MQSSSSTPQSSNGETRHSPRIFLSTSVTSAGCDMIALIGELKGSANGKEFTDSWALERLRDAVSRAAATIANYDRAVAEGRELLSRSEFEAIRPSVGEGA